MDLSTLATTELVDHDTGWITMKHHERFENWRENPKDSVHFQEG